MANIYFGDSGDVWKHLALAEIIASEQPHQMWESHAGSALYPLSHSPGRDIGIYYFHEHVARSAPLLASTYAQILRELDTDGAFHLYPGSPFLALRTLAHGPTTFVFCDTDPASLADITTAAAGLSVDAARLRLLPGDGISTLSQLAADVSPAEAIATLAHIDPYDPLQTAPSGGNALDLLCQLSARGIRCVLWAGYTTLDGRAERLRAVHHAAMTAGTSAERLALWCGDFCLGATRGTGAPATPEALSSLVIGSHLRARSRAACDVLGHELARIYGAAPRADAYGEAAAYTSFLVTDDGLVSLPAAETPQR